MIKELLDKITAAEAEADKMIEDALAEAKDLNRKAEEESAAVIKNAKSYIKELKAKELEAAEKDAQAAYDEILEAGRTVAQKLIETTGTEEAEDYIAKKFLEKYGSR